MAEKPKFRRGTGPNALPQGAAAALNRAQPNFALENTDIPVDFSGDIPDEVEEAPANENMEVLLGDPDPAYRPAVTPRDRAGQVPRYIVRHLPQMMAAVRDPDAPPTLRAVYNAVLRQLENERARGGR